jgi:hypothetical protein
MNDDDKPPRSSLAPSGDVPNDMGRPLRKARHMTRRIIARADVGADLA